ncbi:MAG: hypothetical protein R3357_04665 [Burkholderiales bacterium]|nr:hypothetical protein [Burkholderiales bacterium]
MKRFRLPAIAAFVLVATMGTALARDDASQGVREMWRNAKSEVKQFFGMRSGAEGSGCPMMGGRQSMGGGGMMGGGMMSGGMMGGGSMGGAPNDQWRDERSVPPPTAPRR